MTANEAIILLQSLLQSGTHEVIAPNVLSQEQTPNLLMLQLTSMTCEQPEPSRSSNYVSNTALVFGIRYSLCIHVLRIAFVQRVKSTLHLQHSLHFIIQ